MSTKGKRNVEAMVESIQKSIQEGAPKLPWNRPWDLVGQKSIKTGHTYQGGNGFITAILADLRGWGPGWGTYKQLVGFTGKEKLPGVLVDYKGSLRGQTGIALLRPIFRKEFDETKGKEVQRLVGFAEFVAFNVTQVRYGGKEPAGSAEARLGRIRLEAAKRALVKVEIREHRPIDQAEATIRSFAAGLRGGFHVSDGSNSAHYVPFTDTIRVPNPERFATAAAYYSTVFHECAHATGAEHRLARFKSDEFPGRDAYGAEELVAELAAAYVRAEFGMEGGQERQQSEAYVRHWAEKLSSLDDRTLYKAMSQAVKAAEWVLHGDPALRENEPQRAEEVAA
jgi:antirestriction protein ArdC